jgi:lipoyl(octanoyl) transferase
MLPLRIRYLGLREYVLAWSSMQEFTRHRTGDSLDELWIVEHPPVFTLGLNGDLAHVLDPGSIPVIKVDRGGQVTYHGPGQMVVYLLLDLRRRGMGIRALVTHMEQAVIGFLSDLDIEAQTEPGAPGVYVEGRKIASLGLRVRGGCSYHGLAFNLNMDLAPFARINPCGYRGLQVTQIHDLGIDIDWRRGAHQLSDRLRRGLGYRDSTLETNR